mmetsp:Transcript_19719/g.55632  ORF Transcript_19719/g.55632 Transcript_19719/m.55632 type:complete len:211 (-) Transcript_19719:79-711(-)
MTRPTTSPRRPLPGGTKAAVVHQPSSSTSCRRSIGSVGTALALSHRAAAPGGSRANMSATTSSPASAAAVTTALISAAAGRPDQMASSRRRRATLRPTLRAIDACTDAPSFASRLRRTATGAPPKLRACSSSSACCACACSSACLRSNRAYPSACASSAACVKTSRYCCSMARCRPTISRSDAASRSAASPSIAVRKSLRLFTSAASRRF